MFGKTCNDYLKENGFDWNINPKEEWNMCEKIHYGGGWCMLELNCLKHNLSEVVHGHLINLQDEKNMK